jgi:DNA-binding NtrC family response regulator
MRLGALKPKKVDVRFVAATNRELRKLIAEGRFRADLYFRLNGMSITLPPLRDRTADIGPIARRFAERAAAASGRRVTLSGRAQRALESYSWPGNVRELKNVVDRAVVMCKRGELDVADLVLADPEAFGETEPRDEPSLPPPRGPFGTMPPPRAGVDATLMDDSGQLGAMQNLRGELKTIEKKRILDALAKTAGNQSQAAKMLGMSRYTLIARIEEYGLARPRKR